MAEYEPGICNLGANEIRKRYALSGLGLVISMALVAAIRLSALPGWTLLLTFVPLLLLFEGLYQGIFRFCAGFAARGVYDVSGPEWKQGKVPNAAAHKKDMHRAMLIHLVSSASTVIVTAIIYFALR